MSNYNPHVLVVDDSESNRRLAAQILRREGYRVSTAADGIEALEAIAKLKPDVVLLDIMMPRMDGISVLQQLRASSENELLPVILVTAQSATEDKVQGLDAGASDFLVKPWDISELLARVRAQLRVRMLTRELEHAEQVLYMLARTIEARDAYTMEHTERVAQYALNIGSKLNFTSDELNTLRKGALLHDIGKIGVPDQVLLKNGKLDDAEWGLMKQHPVIGVQITATLQSLHPVQVIIRNHHERWDGHGYPDGLAGDHIPIFARVTAIADAFDAMTSNRPYQRSRSYAEARQILQSGAGSQWDPYIVKTALQVLPQ